MALPSRTGRVDPTARTVSMTQTTCFSDRPYPLPSPRGVGAHRSATEQGARKRSPVVVVTCGLSRPDGPATPSPFVGGLACRRRRNIRFGEEAAVAEEMSFATAEEREGDEAAGRKAAEVHLPADIDWEMLDKSKFFLLGVGLFSGVSTVLYPAIVLKTRLQVSPSPASSFSTSLSILRREGVRGFYRGFGTSLVGTVPARALYMTALEVTKSGVGTAAVRLGVPEPAAATVANAAAGLSAAMAAQVVWTPVDVISQRLMVQSDGNGADGYRGGIDAFLRILRSDGLRGLYRGFGMSIVTYAPSNAVWWVSYSVSQRLIWGGIGCHLCRGVGGGGEGEVLTPDNKTVMVVQGVSAAMAGGISALVTMPLDTIKTRTQVLDGGGRRGSPPTVSQTVRKLLREGGWSACYRGLGPRWASMSASATTMITTYELLKRLSAKGGAGQENLT